MPDRIQTTFGASVRAIVRAGLAASIAAGVIFALWLVVISLRSPHLTAQTFSEVSIGLLASALFWPLAIGVVGAAVTIPLTAAAALVGAVVVRYVGGTPTIWFPAVGFVIGTIVWFLVIRGAPSGAMLFGNVWSAPIVGGIAGLISGITLARHLPLPQRR